MTFFKVEELRTRLDHHIDRAVLPMHREPTNDGQIIIKIIQTIQREISVLLLFSRWESSNLFQIFGVLY